MNPVVGIMMTSQNAGGHNMMEALQKLGWTYFQLAKGEKWTGWKMRMEAYIQFAKSQPLDSILILIDAYDALPIRSPLQFVETFESFQTNIVVGAETMCFGNCVQLDRFKGNTTLQHPYVQGGCVVGRPTAVITLYEWIVKQNIQDDQMGIAMFMNTFPNFSIALDENCKLVVNDNFGTSGVVHKSENGFIFEKNGKQYEPYFIHFPAFLSARSVFQWFQPLEQLKLVNYDSIGKGILGDQFVEIGQIDRPGFIISNIIGLFLFTLCIVFIVGLGIYMVVRLKKSQLISIQK